MRATQILRDEHKVILSVLICLERLSSRFDCKSMEDLQDALGILTFLRVFADACHHGKEEEILFVWMEAKGFSRTQGPTAVMRSEHDEGREWIRQMNEALAGSQQREADFKKAAQCYINLLRQHIEKEDHCLFPMVENILNPEAEESILTDFKRAEQSEELKGQHEKFASYAAALSRKFGVQGAEGVAECCGQEICGHV